jgi:hypothetical protein
MLLQPEPAGGGWIDTGLTLRAEAGRPGKYQIRYTLKRVALENI